MEAKDNVIFQADLGESIENIETRFVEPADQFFLQCHLLVLSLLTAFQLFWSIWCSSVFRSLHLLVSCMPGFPLGRIMYRPTRHFFREDYPYHSVKGTAFQPRHSPSHHPILFIFKIPFTITEIGLNVLHFLVSKVSMIFAWFPKSCFSLWPIALICLSGHSPQSYLSATCLASLCLSNNTVSFKAQLMVRV